MKILSSVVYNYKYLSTYICIQYELHSYMYLKIIVEKIEILEVPQLNNFWRESGNLVVT